MKKCLLLYNPIIKLKYGKKYWHDHVLFVNLSSGRHFPLEKLFLSLLQLYEKGCMRRKGMFKETIVPLSNAEISKITGNEGGKYYGNGVYCIKKKCCVNWGEDINRIGNNMAANWFTGVKISDHPGPKGPTYHSGSGKSRRAGRHYAIN